MSALDTEIGNLDMHSKNLGLLHPREGGVAMALVYDAVPQSHAHNDGRMALSVNGKFRFDEITGDDLHAEFSS